MTSNQINYAKLKEERRHNLVSEVETARHNKRSEDVGFYTGGAAYAGVAENTRHNKEQEAINWYTAENLGDLQAVQADKTASEVGVEAGKLGETQRHNVKSESIAAGTLVETRRHNKVTETQGQQNADTNTRNSYTNIAGTAVNALVGAAKVYDSFAGVSGLFGGKSGKIK